ncbi:uncharacterized protein LOC135394016 [Ornithodoros turicata]|uniref:uncharacterized protein LOC135394016 n=1 Tax=Ornithodoros turicata TaxID=34597 RepID=UPI0031394FC1
MSHLPKKRQVLRSQVTRIITEANSLLSGTGEATLDALDVLIERLQACHQQLNDVDAEIEHSEIEQSEEDFTRTYEYNDRVITCIARLKCKKNGSVQTGIQTTSTTRSTAVKVKLPKLELLKFDGKQRNWQAFWEQFQRLIHQNEDLTQSDKFSYLKSVLVGEAAAAIAGLHLSAECYKDAVELLQQRYGTETAIIQDHMEALLNIRPVRLSEDVRELRKLYDRLQAHIRGLNVLGVSEDSYCSLLYPVLLRSLPRDIVLQYHRKSAMASIPVGVPSDIQAGDSAGTARISDPSVRQYRKKVSDLLQLVRIEVESREQATSTQKTDDKGQYKTSHDRKRQPTASVAALQHLAGKTRCTFCSSQQHETENCDSDIPLTKKKEILRAERRCYRCTKLNHQSRECKSRLRCRKCTGRHAASMCDPSYASKKGSKEIDGDQDSVATPTTSVSLHSAADNSRRATVLLQTATAMLAGEISTTLARIMFDGGSQRSFISRRMAKKLGCKYLETEELTVEVFGGHLTERSFRRVRLSMSSRSGEKSFEIEALETDSICEQILPMIDKDIQSKLNDKNLEPADVIQTDSKEIAVLIGSDYYWEVVSGKVEDLGKGLRAIETSFGWCVQGPIPTGGNVVHCDKTVVLRTVTQERPLEELVTKLWDLDSLGIRETENDDTRDNDVVTSFMETVVKVEDGYQVCLPWKTEVDLESNEAVARKRLHQLLRKLTRDPQLMSEYDNVIRQQLRSGIAEVASPHQSSQGRTYYMPHQAVIREGASTTKLRVVFDASSHDAKAKSLNDNLESGPNLNCDLVALLLNFRKYRVAMVADIEKAFLQIGVTDADRDALRFLWLKEAPTHDQPLPDIETYRMTRVPFGTTSSPFLLAATLQHHLRSLKDEYPVTCTLLSESLYVDDLLVGAADEGSAEKLYREAKSIFQTASMKLHKWASNSPTMRNLFEEEATAAMPQGQVAGVLKVLGLSWNPATDNLTFAVDSVRQISEQRKDTKRFVLQTAARLYDPMGLISPFLVTAKLCFQRTWRLKLGWDEILPDDIRHQWADWCDDLRHLSRIQVPRFYEYGLSDVADSRVLHVFADASTAAYGAVVYLCVRDLTGRTTTTLVLAKSRIAPLKQLTLPRLELMASLVASRLFQYIGGNLKLDVGGVHFWTDSMITLHWIQGDAARWKPFVRNRVTEIQKNSDSHPWHYCPSKENPADLMTRGISAQRLIESQLWWKGPPWIVSDESSWPGRPPTTRFASEELEEMKSQVLTTATSTSTVPVLLDINKYSSVLKLHRTTAWVLRYIHNLKSHVRRSGVLSTEEIEKAEVHWITTVQRMTFQHELSCIEKGSKIPSNSPLRDLTPFIDNDGIIRAGGRLQFSHGTYDERHPRILPGDHHYTKLLVRQTHHQLLHAGIRDTLLQLRENFWTSRQRGLAHFWKRWHKEHLAELQSSRSSRVFKSSALKPGDIVILHDEKQPRPLWKLCRIVDVFCGRDEKVRACTVRLPDGTLRRRPVQLLYPLELANG